ncbi:hypothetical protein [Pseudomonas fluorescens]|uniref:hypothetical protein n=1 Tax=Pseudomonas fluorescens TaxID=294 RepID=UPI00259B0233|nr:hypothetical protein [Pseudomonas fluorescens]WJK09792.1 hypothetical protein QR290_00280 [Pseudomonas fluorescens]
MNKLSSCFGVLGIIAGLSTQPASASDLQTIGELHPPVVASLGDQKITVFFLKNNLKDQVRDVHVPDVEIFYAPMNAVKPSLNYVWKVEGEQIASVFFFERKFPERAGKSMFVLTKHKVLHKHFEGDSYSVLELPLFKDGDHLALQFFRGDLPDPELQNCLDGINREDGVEVECAYKDAASIKKYLADLDGRMISDSKLDQGNRQKPLKIEGDKASAACPSPDFSTFLSAFSERADVQKTFVQQPLKMVTTVAGDPEPEMQKSSLSGDQLKFPIIPDVAKREAQGLTLTVKEERGDHAIAILQKPDTDYVFEYRFVRGQCWQLEEVMDYSL